MSDFNAGAARHHALALEQCALFVEADCGVHPARAMRDAAEFLRALIHPEAEAPAPEPVADCKAMLVRDCNRMRKAGLALSEAASHVIREADGLHRLSIALSGWYQAIADEGDRPHPDPSRTAVGPMSACPNREPLLRTQATVEHG